MTEKGEGLVIRGIPVDFLADTVIVVEDKGPYFWSPSFPRLEVIRAKYARLSDEELLGEESPSEPVVRELA